MAGIVEPRHVWRRHRVEELGLLVDAEAYYRELYRAALTAKRCLLLSGWQFDSGVDLLRGAQATASAAPVTLLGLLEHLCATRPALRICILAWDFNVFFAAEREWMQELVFQWTTHERLSFRFDPNHAELGSHHQKFVVVDDEIVFTGGLDVCDHRWDDRRHLCENPLRMSRGEPHQPFHDLQLWMRSAEVAASLKELFATRWVKAGGEPIDDLLEGPPEPSPYRAHRALPIASSEVVLSRTDPFAQPEGGPPCTEILRLHQDAIAAAEKLIYVETQYLSSRAITEALVARMRAAGRSKLQLIFMLNMRGETFKEQAAVGLAQAQNLGRLREVAADTGHSLGLYFTLPCADGGPAQTTRGTYIHSKLMIVDDRFLTVGSANLTNRSMGVDTELNATVEAGEPDGATARSIRDIRRSLLAEHVGAPVPELERVECLVERLDAAIADSQSGCRLRVHPSPTEGERAALQLIDPDKLPFDPDHVEELDAGLVAALTRAARDLLSSPRAPLGEGQPRP